MGLFCKYSFFVVPRCWHIEKRVATKRRSDGANGTATKRRSDEATEGKGKRPRLHRDRLRDGATKERRSSYVGGEGDQGPRRWTMGVVCALRCGGC